MELNRIKVLAIDDKQDNLVSLKAVIEDMFSGSVIFTALNGPEGIKLAAAEDPDLIFLDIVMPDMDGFEVCSRLKSNESLRDIPVVFLTALKESKENRIQALDAGAEGFLSKPIDEIELIAQIRAMVKIKNANIQKKNEHQRLAALVAERTSELERSQFALLNMLEDLKVENETHRETECQLRESEEKYRSLFQKVGDAIFIHHPDSMEILEANDATSKLYGYDKDELIGLSCLEFSAEVDKSKIAIEQITKLENKTVQYRHHKKKDGSDLYVHISGYKIIVRGDSVMFAVCRDITESKLAEEKILNLLKEKEIILRETHHRVKNNMNTIYGLLSLHADAVKNEESKMIISGAAERVQSMMLLYNKLYCLDNLIEMSMKEFLCPFIDEILGVLSPAVPVKTEISIDNVIVNGNILSTMGIIINELITNTMKYGFSECNEGIISVTAVKREERIFITYKDNGPGIPESVTFENSTGFGMELISMLTESLQGSINIERGGGAKFVLEFDI